MKWLAIVVLMATIAGAGLVLYALNTMTPEVVSVSVVRTSAADVSETLESVKTQVAEGSFTGRVYGDVSGLEAQDCAFETYTVRVKNNGIFPVEWIALSIQAVSTDDGADIAELGDTHAYVLAAGAEGDISATMLTTMPEGAAERQLHVSGYVFGQKFEVDAAP